MKTILTGIGILTLVGFGWAFGSKAPLSSPASGASGTPASPSGAPVRYKIDAGHSSLFFRTLHLQVSNFYGRFNQFEGELVYDAQSPSSSSILVRVRADSVDSNSDGRDQHLRSPDFLSAKEFPEIVFESKSVKGTAEKLSITGELSFHGVTREVTFEALKIGEGPSPFGDQRIGFEGKLSILPKDYGVSFMQDTKSLGPDVELTISLECIRQDS